MPGILTDLPVHPGSQLFYKEHLPLHLASFYLLLIRFFGLPTIIYLFAKFSTHKNAGKITYSIANQTAN